MLIITDPYDTCKKHLLIRINHSDNEETIHLTNRHIILSSSTQEMTAKATFQGHTVSLTNNKSIVKALSMKLFTKYREYKITDL